MTPWWEKKPRPKRYWRVIGFDYSHQKVLPWQKIRFTGPYTMEIENSPYPVRVFTNKKAAVRSILESLYLLRTKTNARIYKLQKEL